MLLDPLNSSSRLKNSSTTPAAISGFVPVSGASEDRNRRTGMEGHYLLVFVCIWAVARAHHSTGNLCDTIRASQSSLHDFRGYAHNAIDRNHDTDYQHGACSRTTMEQSPWWSVDFFYHYRVYVVNITASRDGQGVQGAEIRIGDSRETHGSQNSVCAREVTVPAGQTKYFFCEPRGIHGRYMTIIIPGKMACLSLCEVEAYGAHEPH
ncbi:fucolectin-1-like [Pristis pectinata]|uniref:fucolectin-1-like n=1 Tax=Pristis pectinata TaxID=685728 RepID=UPI00223D2C33|nr:fucolectin-1-like [Pristis pectinata]